MNSRNRSRRARALSAVIISSILCLQSLLPGCALLDVRKDQAFDGTLIRFRGHVISNEQAEGPRVALLMNVTEPGDPIVLDYYVLEGPTRFYFVTTRPGTYAIAAFHDYNGNLVLDPGEPATNGRDATFEMEAGESIEGITINILPGSRPWATPPVDLRAIGLQEIGDGSGYTARQITHSGEVVDLSNARFGPASGELGLWNAVEFLREIGQGVFFLEPYDPKRIPVLFVHGISGYPQEFSELIENLDREKFQPWFYVYASGARLPGTSAHLTQVIIELRLEHGFERLFVVAHSMGGLVSRRFVMRYHEDTGRETIPLLVSLSTPWGGHKSAQKGVDRSPVVIYSWRDIAPNSDFLNSLFYEDPTLESRRRLPAHMQFHLLFGHQRNATLPGVSGDGVVTVASELYPLAQEEADSITGFDVNHRDILRSREASERLNEILADAAR